MTAVLVIDEFNETFEGNKHTAIPVNSPENNELGFIPSLTAMLKFESLTGTSSRNSSELEMSNSVYQCSLCTVQVPSKSSLRKHFQVCLRLPSEERATPRIVYTSNKNFKCDYCPFSTKTMVALMRHKEIHTTFVEDLVKYADRSGQFLRQTDCKMKSQPLIWGGSTQKVQPRSEGETSDTFGNSSEQDHSISIVEQIFGENIDEVEVEKPLIWEDYLEHGVYVCPYDKSKFTLQEVFKQHWRDFHDHEGTKPWKRRVMDSRSNNSFKDSENRTNLKRHLEATEGISDEYSELSPELTVSNIGCEKCPFKTRSKLHLNLHRVLEHTNTGQTFRCCLPNCNGAFNWRSGLYRHLKEVHKITLGIDVLKKQVYYTCPMKPCLYKTTVENRVIRHLRCGHKVEGPQKCTKRTSFWKDTGKIHNSSTNSDSTFQEASKTKYLCPNKNCLFETSKRNTLENHLRTIHSMTEINIYNAEASIERLKVVSCRMCSFFTKEDELFEKHFYEEHSSPKSNWMFRCCSCFFETDSKKIAYKHGKRHRVNVVTFSIICQGKRTKSVNFRYRLNGKDLRNADGLNEDSVQSQASTLTAVFKDNNLSESDHKAIAAARSTKDCINVKKEHGCHICNSSFHSPTSCQMSVYGGENQLTCPQCDILFFCADELSLHMITDHDREEMGARSIKSASDDSDNSVAFHQNVSHENSKPTTSSTLTPTTRSLKEKSSVINTTTDDWLPKEKKEFMVDIGESEFIRIEITDEDNQDDVSITETIKTLNESIRIKCRNPGCNYFSNNVNEIQKHASHCSKIIRKKRKPARKVNKDEILKGHKSLAHLPGKMSYKCLSCGDVIYTRSMVSSHVNLHAREEDNYELKLKFSQYKGDIKVDDVVFRADKTFVPRSSTHVRWEEVADGMELLEYDPSLPVFECTECNFKSNQDDELTRHKKLHWSEEKEKIYNTQKWIVCEVCYFHCFDIEKLEQHRKEVHR